MPRLLMILPGNNKSNHNIELKKEEKDHENHPRNDESKSAPKDVRRWRKFCIQTVRVGGGA